MEGVTWLASCSNIVWPATGGPWPRNAADNRPRLLRPSEWSPEDAKAPYRRRLENVEDPAWVDTLPKLGERSEEE